MKTRPAAVKADTSPGRRRGGQPGNKNAFKHGFYTALFKDRERQLLEQMQPADLSAEIELIRVTSARFLESLAASKERGDFEANLTALRLVNLSAQSIAMLLRVQALSGSLRKDMDDALKALEVVAERLNITEEPDAPDADPHSGPARSP